ncbi:family 43 glycosylhydrolase [Streptomyces sp. NBC_00882]|uniref:family 43 glycosylhydrolase n=1 Tax=Streptomyces sp. NBC_00882 TaxID=2975856 RepID=UPI002E36CD70|nr:family 43 glycosylhydrolase [Streptomyces canus]WSZ34845.1 family 43 glycosylhydrolase [Streptomyces sp. NBC_00882]
MQHVYTAGPAPLVYNGRVYLYTGHDEDGSTSSFVMNDWRVWSSADMVNWTDHGSPLSLATFSWASTDAWAGQAVERGGKFYCHGTDGGSTRVPAACP